MPSPVFEPRSVSLPFSKNGNGANEVVSCMATEYRPGLTNTVMLDDIRLKVPF